MTALTSNYEAKRQDGIILSYPVKGSTTIYKGALLNTPTTGSDEGYVEPATDADNKVFVGIAVEGVNNSAGSRGDKTVRVYKTGTFQIPKASSTQADVNSPIYVVDDNTVGATTSHSVFAGYIVGLVNSSTVKLRIDLAVDVDEPSAS